MSTAGWVTPHATTDTRPVPPALHADGLCAHPPGNALEWVPDSELPANVQPQVAVCCRCPVMDVCLQYALASGVHGIWAGMTTRQRHALRARRVHP